ncbi:unnamed protein product [Brachionus calyciflorus]|uniref:Uncharacterized protein n=1 Tax=Brachionus calyciflorus TaxID=104777 RepID=A0A813UFG7_9BILA|nr:unnamed protein product [Brachionus calyciflorus]
MHEDIIWQREIKNALDLNNHIYWDQADKVIQLPNGFYYIYQNYDEVSQTLSKISSNLNSNLNSNNNNSNIEEKSDKSYFTLSDLCCNLHIYLKNFFVKNKKFSDQINDLPLNSNNNNNNLSKIQPKCQCWTIENFIVKNSNTDMTDTLKTRRKLIKLNDKEKFDLLNVENLNETSESCTKEVKVIDTIDSDDSLSSIITNFSFNHHQKNGLIGEINYLKKRSSELSVEISNNDHLFKYPNNFESLRASIESGKSSLNDTLINDAILNLGVNLSEVSTCTGSLSSNEEEEDRGRKVTRRGCRAQRITPESTREQQPVENDTEVIRGRGECLVSQDWNLTKSKL